MINNAAIQNVYNKYGDFSYGSKAGSKGENGEIDCSGLVCKILEEKGAINAYSANKSSQGLWMGSTNKKTYDDAASFKQKINDIPDETIIAFSTGNSLSDNRKYGIDHVGIVTVGGNGKRYIVESASSKGGPSVTLLSERINELEKKNLFSNRKGYGVIFTGEINYK